MVELLSQEGTSVFSVTSVANLLGISKMLLIPYSGKSFPRGRP